MTETTDRLYTQAEVDEFQNRKRYGGMRDFIFQQLSRCRCCPPSFKTVNGMEACVT